MNFMKNLFSTTFSWVGNVIKGIFGPTPEGSDETRMVRFVRFLVAFIVLTFLLQVATGMFGWWASLLDWLLSMVSGLASGVVDASSNAIDSTSTVVPPVSPSDVPSVE